MAERPPIRLALDEAAFRDLVAGRVVRLKAFYRPLGDYPGSQPQEVPVELILSDIGFGRMWQAIDDAEREQGRG